LQRYEQEFGILMVQIKIYVPSFGTPKSFCVLYVYMVLTDS